MAALTSSGLFYTTKVRAALAWWNQPEQHAPTKVLQCLRHVIKIQLDRPMQPFKLAPCVISEPKDIDFAIKDLAKGR